MTYQEIKELCEKRQLPIKVLAENLGMTPAGFQRAIENQTLPIRLVPPLCDALGLDITKLFGTNPANPESDKDALISKLVDTVHNLSVQVGQNLPKC